MADDITMESGYTEKIPYGIVETTNSIYSSLHYEYNSHVQADFGIQYQMIDNAGHIKGDSHSDISIFCRLLIEYTKYFRF